MKTEEDVARALHEPRRDLWSSKYRTTDRTLVLTERPIDAISFEQTRGNQTASYVAVGSRLGDDRKRRIAAILMDMPPGMTVVLRQKQLSLITASPPPARLPPRPGSHRRGRRRVERRLADREPNAPQRRFEEDAHLLLAVAASSPRGVVFQTDDRSQKEVVPVMPAFPVMPPAPTPPAASPGGL